MTTPVTKPIPEPDDVSAPFWEGARDHRLMLMKCSACGMFRLPARNHCPGCLSDESTWEQASGKGTIRTFGVMHQRYHPAFETPYNIAIVELAEGPRITTNIVGADLAELSVGMAVTVEWEDHDDVALPKFHPA